MTTLRTPEFVLCGVVLATLCSWGQLVTPREHRTPVLRTHGTSEEQGGGEETKFEVELVPHALVKSGSKERIAYHAEIKNKERSSGAVAWSGYLVRDDGEVVGNIPGGSGQVSGASVFDTEEISPILDDGYYMIVVRAAKVGNGEENVAEGVQAIEVTNGSMAEISTSDWFTKTRTAIARPLGEINGGTPQ